MDLASYQKLMQIALQAGQFARAGCILLLATFWSKIHLSFYKMYVAKFQSKLSMHMYNIYSS